MLRIERECRAMSESKQYTVTETKAELKPLTFRWESDVKYYNHKPYNYERQYKSHIIILTLWAPIATSIKFLLIISVYYNIHSAFSKIWSRCLRNVSTCQSYQKGPKALFPLGVLGHAPQKINFLKSEAQKHYFQWFEVKNTHCRHSLFLLGWDISLHGTRHS